MIRAAIAMLGLLAALAGAAAAEPLAADRAFALTVTRGPDQSLTLRWRIAEGYYLYRDRIAARGPDGAPLDVETAPGTVKDDPTFGRTEVYYGAAEAVLATPGGGPIEVVYQGCQDGGICYAPDTRRIDPASLAVSAAAPPAMASAEWQTGPADAALFDTPPADTAPINAAPDDIAPVDAAPAAGGGAGFRLADDGGLVQSLLGDGGGLLVLAMFPLFGLLLAFTPCVFPMYPILAGALAREGDGLTARRGFVLSGIYVLALAAAFALLGAAAGWSGQNLQMMLQSPYTLGVLAAVFVALALSMFGLYELQLPAAWTRWITARTGGRGGSKRSAALLGFSSALIVGPCVTVPLAGALLYIAQTGDVVLGAAALFGLGVGKGLPLIVMGTLGGSYLPRAGAWMDGVKRLFGFGFLATAIWTAAPLLPAGLELALWGVLLIFVASFAFTARWPGSTGLATGRALGAAAMIYGALLMIGASSGGTDPLRPLAALAGRGAPAAAERALDFATVGTAPELRARLASADGRPTLVYVTAEWCVTCRVIERSVLPHDAVRRQLAGFQLVKADLTDYDGDSAALMDQLGVAGPPTMLFFDGDAQEVADTRLVGNVTVESLTRSAGRLAAF